MRTQVAIILIALLQIQPLALAAQSAETVTSPTNDTTLAKLAASGDLQAQLDIAQAYRYGIGREKDRVEAVRWYEAAAEQSSAPAMYELGSLVLAGFSAGDTSPEANAAGEMSFGWFRKAAILGFGPAQATLGLLYGFGDSVEVDRVTGRMWMEVADTNDHPVQKMMKRALERQMSEQELALAFSRAETCISSSYSDCD